MRSVQYQRIRSLFKNAELDDDQIKVHADNGVN